jgi:hypothetical protein
MDHADLAGYLCEQCLDAPAIAFVPAPGGGEMGICEACAAPPPVRPKVDERHQVARMAVRQSLLNRRPRARMKPPREHDREP